MATSSPLQLAPLIIMETARLDEVHETDDPVTYAVPAGEKGKRQTPSNPRMITELTQYFQTWSCEVRK
ncbi:uncharacterized protein LOC143238770 isoform X2 [Tachypleus tridentatus]|uniref:uncharacterized protein LOC143238770 isoform X2 n=1 Tax=Tachypleus tridentatus TaxID=6853 RepID=UPI003FD3E820